MDVDINMEETHYESKKKIITKEENSIIFEVWRNYRKKLLDRQKRGHILKKIYSELRDKNVCLNKVELTNRMRNLTHKYKKQLKARAARLNSEQLNKKSIISGINELEQCGKIYWNQHDTNLLTFSCKFCFKLFESLDDFCKHLRIHYNELDNIKTICHNDNELKEEMINNATELNGKEDLTTNLLIEEYVAAPCTDEDSEENLDEIRECIIPSNILEINISESNSKNNNHTSNTQQLDIIGKDNPIKCRFCDQIFSSTTDIQDHERLHIDKHDFNAKANMKGFKCDRCDLIFQSKSYLIVHKRRHDGIKMFKCSFCEKAFVTRGDRRKHESTHTNDRLFLCTECGKSFRAPSSYYTHIRTHANIKLHKCEICNKAFITPAQLKTHSMVHNNDKPFVCNKCNTSFKRKKNLKDHAKLHDDVGQYVCRICGKIFKQHAGLYSHMKSH